MQNYLTHVILYLIWNLVSDSSASFMMYYIHNIIRFCVFVIFLSVWLVKYIVQCDGLLWFLLGHLI
jgi:hypothetical protein